MSADSNDGQPSVNVLLVEDNPGDARLVKEYLADATTVRVELTWVTRVAEAVAAMKEGAFDVVLLDLSLPDGRGLDVYHQLRDVDAEVPLVVLSGEGDEQLAMVMVREGAQDYLVKGRVDGFTLVRSLRFALQRLEQTRKLREVALFDGLTKLPNRMSFLETLKHAVAQARRYQRLIGLLFVDLDGFKAVNDGHGHPAGDEVLRVVADRLREATRESDFVARLGGDEFTIILPSVEHRAEAEIVAMKVIELVGKEIALPAGPAVAVSASVGIAFYPDDAPSVEVLLERADAAMYAAKNAGKNRYVLFSAREITKSS